MMKNKIRIAVIAFLSMFLFIGCAESLENNSSLQKQKAALVVKSTESAFWKSVISGAKTASTAFNMELEIGGPPNEEDYETQNELIEKAVSEGIKVIIFSAVDYNASVEVIENAVKKGVEFIIIDSDVNTDKVIKRIGTDNYKAGVMSGKALLKSDEKELHIGIVNFDINSQNGQERERGFKEAISEDERANIVKTINVLSTTEDAKRETMELLQEYPEINAIATFNEWTSLGVGYAIQELGLKDTVRVVAFDCNIVSVEMLETGEVDVLIVQNPYAMGYLAVEAAYNTVNGFKIGPEKVDTSTRQVTSENMYDEENQKALFAFE